MDKTKFLKLLQIWLPLFLWMLIIFLFSSRPTIQASTFDPVDFVIKKTAHLTEYAFLLVLLFRAIYLTFTDRLNRGKVENLAVFFSFIYAVSDEWHQSFISGRTATLRDILIDFIGIMIGLTAIKFIKHQKKLTKVRHFIYGKI